MDISLNEKPWLKRRRWRFKWLVQNVRSVVAPSSRMESGGGMSNEGPETERLLVFCADARHEDHLIFRPINLDLSSNYK